MLLGLPKLMTLTLKTMKKLADFANRVQDLLKHCTICEDDVMRMLFSEDFVYNFFNEIFLYEECRNDMWFSMGLSIDYDKFNTLKELTPSLCIFDNYDDKVIITNSGDYIEQIVFANIKIHFKSIPLAKHQAEYDLISAARKPYDNGELIKNFLMKFIDFEKTIGELRNVDNMWDENIYLNEKSTTEYDDSTFEDMLKVLNIYERKLKITEFLNN